VSRLEHTRHTPVTEIIGGHARDTPDHVAVRQGDATWTYGRLWTHSGELAAAVRAAGVRPGDAVAVCGTQSCALVGALLAVLRSRAVLVSIDPSLPAARIATMLYEAKVHVVVDCGGAEALAPVLAANGRQRLLATATASETLDEPRIEDAAYIFFTSGTTGVPKGILGTHDGLAHFLEWQRTRFGIAVSDRCAQLTGLSFDVVLRSIFLPLTSGATLCLPEQADPDAIVPWLIASEATLVHVVPSLAQVWLAKLPATVVGRTLRYVFFAGEPLSDVLVRSWRRVFPACTVVNLYGPTETTLAKCHYVVPDPPDPGIQPVGFPLPSTEVIVVDEEVLIRTPFRTRGYINAPDELWRFQAWGDDPDDIVYRTGDRARLRADGALALMGRVDDQVKIRGVRIEPAEVSAVLAGHPRVVACFVAAVLQPEPALVAYVVGAASAAELRTFLAERVMAPLIPAYFVALDALPLTPNGKVDRKALPPPDRSASYVAARTRTERVLADIWVDALGVAQVGIDDDFFELGGHSLLAMRIVSRIRDAFAVDLPGRVLFDAPTVAAVAAEIDRSLGLPQQLPLEPAHRDAALALSFAQQRLWFLANLDSNSSAYNLPSAHRLHGPLDIEALRRAFEALLARHEALRTVFPPSDGEPRPKILPPGPFSLPIDDVTELEAEHRATEAALVRLDLANGPLLVARVLRLDAADHILLVTVHHLVFDGWSMAVLWSELAALYGAFVRGVPPSLPPLAIQYADYAAWQRRWLTGDVLDREVAYWKQQLAGANGDLPLPYRGPRPPVATYHAKQIGLTLDPDLAAGLRELARRNGATLFMVLIGALRVLLARYTSETDICIGTAIANRGHREIEGLVGFFVNTMVLRGRVGARDRFVDLLARERELALAAYANQDAPFELVVNALGLERSTNRMPLIQVMCVDQGEVAREDLSGVTVEPFRIGLALEAFDLALDTSEHAGRREITIRYNVELFDHETVVGLFARYERLLAELVGRPEAPLAELELLAPAERAALFDEPARRVIWEPRGATGIEQIERAMRDHPDATAILFGDSATTYRELDVASARLAALLRRAGVGPDRAVAVIAERCPQQIIGMVATLRAGGAYVPIKPDLPAVRIALMIEETAPAAILCAGAPPPNIAGTIIRLDAPWPDAQTFEPPPPPPPEALAYIIYTSGSTGQPKGVMVTRRNFDAQLNWLQATYALDTGDRMFQLTSAMFDVSVMEIFWPLVAGAALILPDRDLDPVYLCELAARHGATVVNFVPSLLRVVLEAQTPWTTIARVFCGGEALPLEVAHQFSAVFPRAELHNQYGPTETTINATSWQWQPNAKRISIGHPIADTTAYVLDGGLSPVPPGGIGELWLGGVQVARGYLGHASLTADRFRPDSFASRAGERIYRTGDLVRQSSDGVLDYVGRADFQVKLRGFRIELGEIEAVLASHPHVRAAVVIVRDDQLVAYVCTTETSDLARYVAERLPAYMVPSAFVVLDELPITPGGKLDRNALPPPGSNVDAMTVHEAPRTATEQALAKIWCELLRVERVSIHDNFFKLGGHSLLALQLVTKVRRGLKVEVSLRDVFAAPTIAQLAALAAFAVPSVAALPGAVVPLQLTEGPTGILQLYHHLTHEVDPSRTAMLDGWIVRGPIDPSAVERAVTAIAVRHDILRTSYAFDGTLRQIVHPPEPPFLPTFDYEDAIGRSAADAIAAGGTALSQPALDASRPPWMKVKLIRIAPEEHVLLVLVDHISFDGGSLELFRNELAAHYRGAVAAPLPFQFLDVTAYLNSYLDSAQGKAGIAYWKSFADVPPPPMPLDFSRAEVDAERAASEAANGHPYIEFFPVGFTKRHDMVADAVMATARREGVPPLVYLLAGLTELLHVETGQDEVVFQTTVNMRPLLGAEQLIGGFNGPIFVRIRRPSSWRDLLIATRDAFATACSHVLVHPLQLVPSHAGRINVGFTQATHTFELGPAVATPTDTTRPGVVRRQAFDLRPTLDVDGSTLSVSFAYNARLFRPETAERMCDRFLAILRAASEP
jgi:amino acid adenylation domain-containing protein